MLMLMQVGGASTRMEPAAARVCLQFLLEKGVQIKHFVTDRSSSLRTLLSLEFPQISHQFDCWHYVKVQFSIVQFSIVQRSVVVYYTTVCSGSSIV